MIIKLTLAAVVPVLIAAQFLFLEKRTRYGRLGFWPRQILVGGLFGIIACLATQFGIPVEGAVLNLRNAAPLTAGLVFGGPAGLIAGGIGAVYRYISVWWGVASYTRVACTLGTLIAGVISAAGRKFIVENKRIAWIYGFAIGAVSEVIHVLLLFITKPNEIQTAFGIMQACAIPMIVGNGVSLMFAMIIFYMFSDERKERKQGKRGKIRISAIFQAGLAISIVISFAFTATSTFLLQNKIFEGETFDLLEMNANMIHESIETTTNSSIARYTSRIAEDFAKGRTGEANDDHQLFYRLMKEYQVKEMYYADSRGINIFSSDPERWGQPMMSGFFSVLAYDPNEVGGSSAVLPFDEEKGIQYAGSHVEGGGVMIAGFDKEYMTDEIVDLIHLTADGKKVGENGYLLVCDDRNRIVSSGYGDDETNLKKIGINPESAQFYSVFEAAVYEEDAYCMAIPCETFAGTYTVLAVYPAEEAEFSRNIAIYVTLFLELLVFTILFVCVYILIKRVVVNNIHRVNGSLSKITDGDLNERIEIRDNEEFDSLSNDINSTVDTLKHYIDEANARIDKDLAFAKEIQESVLPNVFPPYPKRKDFDIFASMDAAKVVGGDFYDLYLLDRHHLVFLVADVSGKSIPGAMFMMRSKTILKSMVEKGMEVDEVFSEANAYLAEGNRAKMFVTAWLGIVDMRTGMLSFANAGHNPPLIRHKNGGYEYLRCRPNFVLAGKKNIPYRKNQLQLLPGDELFLYTDGVTEAVNLNNELFGEDRLMAVLNETLEEGVEERCGRVHQRLEEFVGEAEQFDDITMLSVSLNWFSSSERIITSTDPACAQAVWQFTDEKMTRAKVGEKCAKTVQIVIDEIYSNILRYSGATQAEIFFTVGRDTMTLLFIDDGVQYNPLERPDPDVTLKAKDRKIGGLGIYMVKKMAEDVHYEYKDGRNQLTVILSTQEN